MGAREDRDHFKRYRHQTAVKHAIISKYLPVYFDILKGVCNRLVYIDAFAGAGYYTDLDGVRFAGSPINALELLRDKPRFQELVRCIFSEPDTVNFGELTSAVDEFMPQLQGVSRPVVVPASFEELIAYCTDQWGPDLDGMAPSFLLVDPCGIKGASMQAIGRVLAREFSEAFIFFNFAGLARVVGANLSETVAALFGDAEATEEVAHIHSTISSVEERERAVLGLYEKQLRMFGKATHVCPFRIEYEARASTSHYLVHACKHPLAFAIMKDIMWDLGSGDALELRQKSEVAQSELLFVPTNTDVDTTIESQLEAGAKKVAHFTEALARRSDDRVAPKYYKARIKVLEDQGKVQVYRAGKPYPAQVRRKYRGSPTLPDDCEVRLVT